MNYPSKYLTIDGHPTNVRQLMDGLDGNMDNIQVTEHDFKAFEAVKESGVTNMFDVVTVSRLSGLDRKTIIRIMETYRDFKAQWGKIGLL